MELEIREYDLDSSEPTVLMHEDDCRTLGVSEGDRVRLCSSGPSVAMVSMSDTLVEVGSILVPQRLREACGLEYGELCDVTVSHPPESVRFIRDKMDGKRLSDDQIAQIVDDTMTGRLSRTEIAAWLTALHIRRMDIPEIATYTKAMADSGGHLEFDRGQVFDFHSFGGLPGNKITPIVVSIAAASGLLIPKLSSRAISSACGTADILETFCRIDLSDEEVAEITKTTGGVFSWTGATDLGPAGDRFITVQRPLGVDPRPQMLASILSKKVAAGATDLVMDIPMGSESKVPTVEMARGYARDLMDLGDMLGMRIECMVTYAEQPLGEAIGPTLEAKECMQVLENLPGHDDVAEKACICAGAILEMSGIANGREVAKEVLVSGRAHQKFREIIAAQGGDPDIRSEDMVPGAFCETIVSDRAGFVKRISNKRLVSIAKSAGAPGNKGAGILMGKKLGSKVSSGDVLFTIYADSPDKLRHAVEKAKTLEPVEVEGMLLDRISPGRQT